MDVDPEGTVGRLGRLVDGLSSWLFGRSDPDARDVGFVPGNGGRGGSGGQVPPTVPYDRDWDVGKRRREQSRLRRDRRAADRERDASATSRPTD